ncbi:related to hydroxysteroid 17-beta dehydrogenase 11 [Fusarium oxysporum]|uniref:Related to hydroxysteroid 17-beta dehydrogenase 11 n=1 Tax=Fusarium oxysporum TaxID=5507 RepID=A0A2H3TVR0_FUSOX|nr:related to hydroxysteroid 17-beta dehydrogenase 11 [Fusarium oxysporum]
MNRLEIQDRLLAIINPNALGLILSSKHTPVILRTLGALGLAYTINKAFNRLALNNSSSWDWRREIVLVTGGSSGLGELVVRKLAKRCVKVVAVDLNAPTTLFPANVSFYKLDVTNPEKIRRVAQVIRDEVGEPTVLVNNAGVAAMKPILEETDQEIRRTFEVNIVAHFFLVRELLPHMIKENHGHIITIASMASFVTLASNVDYSCSKAAALTFHEGLTQELKYRYNANNVYTRQELVHNIPLRGLFANTII